MWSLFIQYAWWHEAIYEAYGRDRCAYLSWRYDKDFLLKDQYHENMQDLVGAYCAGGEL